MEREIEELRRQRDLAQSQVDELQKKLQEDQQASSTLESPPRPSVKKCLSYSDALLSKLENKEISRCDRARKTMLRQSMRQSSTAPFTLMHEIRKLEHLQEQLGEEANRALEVLQKEVACHRLGNQDAAETIAKLQAEIREMQSIQPASKEVEIGSVVAPNKSVSANLKDEITRLHSQGSTIANLEEQLENVQKSIDKLVMSLPSNDSQLNCEAPAKAKNQQKKKKGDPADQIYMEVELRRLNWIEKIESDPSFLALGEWSSTGASNFPSIWCVDEFLEIWILEVLAKARLLFLDLAAAS
ncbi:conserved hypothetical protein [Ricinus communis]|uniref:NPK1-activating kinesin-like protein C-terminal domain-containing protein n=1 Tax=Ricinus communis TaxID=3988 RepID=B9SFX7_RICCO|nr:conserved hypothetical protein [Ricinus communis]